MIDHSCRCPGCGECLAARRERQERERASRDGRRSKSAAFGHAALEEIARLRAGITELRDDDQLQGFVSAAWVAKRLDEILEVHVRPPRPIETIAAAALRVNGEVWTLPRPARHHALIRAWSDSHWIHDPETETGHGGQLPGDHVQGFVTSKGRFVDRHEAKRIARAAGQVTGEIIGGELTSEDLW